MIVTDTFFIFPIFALMILFGHQRMVLISLGIASAMPLASPLLIGTSGLKIYVLLIVILMVRILIIDRTSSLTLKAYSDFWPFIIFGLFAFGVTALCLQLFAGEVTVFPPNAGLSIYSATPLAFTNSIINQTIYLIFYIITLPIIAYYIAERKNENDVYYALLVSFIFVLSCVILRYIFPNFIELTFVSEEVVRSQGVVGMQGGAVFGHRPSGSFPEPSFLGKWLVAATGFFIAAALLKFKYSRIALILAALSIVSTTSFSAYYASALVFALTLFIYAKFIATRNFSHSFNLLYLLSFGVIAVLTFFFSFYDVFGAYIFSKSETYSYFTRFAVEKEAFNTFLATSGLGTGIGTNRTSALITTLLVNVGIIGTALFLYFPRKVYTSYRKKFLASVSMNRISYEDFCSFTAFSGMILMMLVASADLSDPLFSFFTIIGLISVYRPKA